jgi:hypothetical protein
MVDILDPNQYEIVSDTPAPTGAVPSSPSPPPSSSVASSASTAGAELKGDFEVLPSYVSGQSEYSPINRSPLSVEERAILSTGNTSGKLKYLKNKFEDAKIDRGGDFLVKDKGLWHVVDPKGLGDVDAWDLTKKIVGSAAKEVVPGLGIAAKMFGKKLPEVTSEDIPALKQAGKELASDAADLYDVGVVGGSGAIGAALGGYLGGGAGAAAGAGIGGSVGEAMRTSLGRLYGTYDATPEQQAKDVAWEGMLNMGGEMLALGAKPTYEVLKKSLGRVSDWTTNFTKENLSAVWGKLTESGRWSMRRALDGPDNVIKHAEKAIDEIGSTVSPLEGVGVLQRNQNKTLETLADGSSDALGNQYRSELSGIIKNTPDDFKGNVSNMVNGTLNELASNGYGKWVAPSSGGNPKFVLLSDADIASKMGVPEEQLPKIIGPRTREALNTVVDTLNKYQSAGTLSGKSGAKKLMDLKRAVNESLDNLFDDSVPKDVQRVVAQVKNSFEQKMLEPFEEAGIKDAYLEMNKNYSASKDVVDLLKKATDPSNIGGKDAFVKQLVSKSGANRSLKDEIKVLADLMGPQGHKAVQDILDMEAAKGFLDFVPKNFSGSSATNASQWAGLALGPVSPANPRAIAKQIQYGSKFIDMLQQLGPKSVEALMRNDNLINGAIRTSLQASDSEDKNVEALLQKAGILPQ